MAGDGDSIGTTVSWPVATWVAPVVPTLVLWVVLGGGLLGDRAGVLMLAAGGVALALAGLVASMALLALGYVLTRRGSARVRGLGVGLAAGSVMTAAAACVFLAGL